MDGGAEKKKGAGRGLIPLPAGGPVREVRRRNPRIPRNRQEREKEHERKTKSNPAGDVLRPDARGESDSSGGGCAGGNNPGALYVSASSDGAGAVHRAAGLSGAGSRGRSSVHKLRIDAGAVTLDAGDGRREFKARLLRPPLDLPVPHDLHHRNPRATMGRVVFHAEKCLFWK